MIRENGYKKLNPPPQAELRRAELSEANELDYVRAGSCDKRSAATTGSRESNSKTARLGLIEGAKGNNNRSLRGTTSNPSDEAISQGLAKSDIGLPRRYAPRSDMYSKSYAFTLSEVLITLVIIGIIAAITVPAVIVHVRENQYKAGYKKAYSDISRVVNKGIAMQEFPVRDARDSLEITKSEWDIIKSGFNVIKVCENNNAFDCWKYGDNWGGSFPLDSARAFVDVSGRSWAIYSTQNVIFVDTNGETPPNRFGKDQWVFTLEDINGKRVCETSSDCPNPGTPAKVAPRVHTDIFQYGSNCHYPPCYYKSWLIEN